MNAGGGKSGGSSVMARMRSRLRDQPLAAEPISVVDRILGLLVVVQVFWPSRLTLAGHGVLLVLGLFTLAALALFNYRLSIGPLSRYLVPVIASAALCLVFVVNGELTDGVKYMASRLIPIMAAFTFATSKRKFLYLVDLTICIGTVMALLTFVESSTETNVFDVLSGSYVEYYGANGYRFGLPRVRSFSSLSINYCLDLVLITSVTLYRISCSKRKTIYIICYICMVVSAVLTFSRSTLLILILVNIVIMILAGLISKPLRFLGVVVALFLIAVFVFLVAPQGIRDMANSAFLMFAAMFSDDAAATMASTADTNVGGSGDRLDLFGEVMKQMPGYEVFGQGYNADFYYFKANGTLKESLENAFLNIYFHYGLVGFLGTMLWFIWVLLYLLRRYKNNLGYDTNLAFTGAMFMAIGAFLVCGLACAYGDSHRILCLVIGMAMAYCELGDAERKAADADAPAEGQAALHAVPSRTSRPSH